MPTKKDATGGSFEFDFGGETYTVPAAEEWPIDVLEAIDENKLTFALKALVGDDQYARFRKANKTVKSLGEFMEAATKRVGAGN